MTEKIRRNRSIMGSCTSVDEYEYGSGVVRNKTTGKSFVTSREKARNRRGCYSKRPASGNCYYDRSAGVWKDRNKWHGR